MSNSDVAKIEKVCAKCGKDVAQIPRVKDEEGSYYCKNCWDLHRNPDVSKVVVSIRRGNEKREIVVLGQTVAIGSASKNHIVLPFAWMRPRHLVVRHDAGLTRVILSDPDAQALLENQPIGSLGAMLPPGESILIPAPAGPPIAMEFQFKGANKGAVLIDEAVGLDPTIPVTEVAGISPLDEKESIFKSAFPSAVPTVSLKKALPHQKIIWTSIGIVFVAALGALALNDIGRSRHSAAIAKDFTEVVQDISKAQTLVAQGQYVEAKSLVDQATQIAAGRTEFSDQILILKSMSARPEIKFGGLGYILMEGQWLPPETARAWRMSRDRDDPKIKSLMKAARAALAANKDLEKAQLDCEEVLALMASEPVHPHPLQMEANDLRDDIHNRIVAVAMTAKGFILYNKKWVTPAERFRLEQQAKGLALYKGKWMPKDTAFAAEQTDKGLVLYQGKWMTPDEEKLAEGFVKFEDAWITPVQRDQIIQQRAEAARLEQQRQEQERIAAEQEAERKRKEQKAIEAKYQDAYLISQQFVKDSLKSPTTAQFQPYDSPKVIVTYSDGWYIVSAVVDSQNGFGAMVRTSYICKVRPTTGTNWQMGPEGVDFPDN